MRHACADRLLAMNAADETLCRNVGAIRKQRRWQVSDLKAGLPRQMWAHGKAWSGCITFFKFAYGLQGQLQGQVLELQ